MKYKFLLFLTLSTFALSTFAMQKARQQKEFVCDYPDCNQSFKNSSKLTYHKNIQHTKKYVCDVCQKPWGNNWQLETHLRTHTGEKPFKCEFEDCKKTFAKKTDLIRHLKTHTGEKPYQCNQCEKAFTQSQDLTRHEMKHTGDTFKCNQCDKTYAQKRDLIAHIRIHTGETFQCDQCNKSFVKKSDLTRHIRIHTGETFQCDKCNKTFVKKSNLTRHIRIHTGEKPFKCEQCGTAFADESNLKHHKKTQKCLAAAAAVAASMQANLDQAPQAALEAAATNADQDMAMQQHAGDARKATNSPKGQRPTKKQKTAAVQQQTEQQLVGSAPIEPSMEYTQQVSEQADEFDLDKWFQQQEAQDAQKAQQAPAMPKDADIDVTFAQVEDASSIDTTSILKEDL